MNNGKLVGKLGSFWINYNIFHSKNYFLRYKNALAYYNAGVVDSRVVGLAPSGRVFFSFIGLQEQMGHHPMLEIFEDRKKVFLEEEKQAEG
jgi:hypothetical protein